MFSRPDRFLGGDPAARGCGGPGGSQRQATGSVNGDGAAAPLAACGTSSQSPGPPGRAPCWCYCVSGCWWIASVAAGADELVASRHSTLTINCETTISQPHATAISPPGPIARAATFVGWVRTASPDSLARSQTRTVPSLLEPSGSWLPAACCELACPGRPVMCHLAGFCASWCSVSGCAGDGLVRRIGLWPKRCHW